MTCRQAQVWTSTEQYCRDCYLVCHSCGFNKKKSCALGYLVDFVGWILGTLLHKITRNKIKLWPKEQVKQPLPIQTNKHWIAFLGVITASFSACSKLITKYLHMSTYKHQLKMVFSGLLSNGFKLQQAAFSHTGTCFSFQNKSLKELKAI